MEEFLSQKEALSSARSESIKPALSVAPYPAKVSNPATLQLQGTTSDASGIDRVELYFDGDWRDVPVNAQGKWTVTLDGLSPGENRLKVRSIDLQGNKKSQSITLYNTVMAELHVEIEGPGGIKGKNTQLLEVGKPFTVNSIPNPGNILGGWFDKEIGMDYPISNTPNYTNFMPPEGVQLVATFVTNIFLPFKGTYSGIYKPEPTVRASTSNSGFLQMTLNDKAIFSGKVSVLGQSVPISGQLDSSGYASLVLPKTSPVAGRLYLFLWSEGDMPILTGYLSRAGSRQGSTIDCVLLDNQLGDSPAGQYNLTLANDNTDNADLPLGAGMVSLTLTSKGLYKALGTLADGTPFTAGGSLAHGQLPLFLAPHKSNQGLLVGWIGNYTAHSQEGEFNQLAMGGYLLWDKPEMDKEKLFPAGFHTSLTVDGSLYSANDGAALSWPMDGSLLLSGGNLGSTVVSNHISLINNRVQVLENNPYNLSVTLDADKGSFKGSYRVPGTKTIVPFSGLIHGDHGNGLFLGTNSTGVVLLRPE